MGPCYSRPLSHSRCSWPPLLRNRQFIALNTLRLALNAAGLHQVTVRQRPRLLNDNGPSYLSAPARRLARGAGYDPHPRQALPSDDPGQNRTLPPLAQESHSTGELLFARELEARLAEFIDFYNTSALPREPRQSHSGRYLLRARIKHSREEAKDQTPDHRITAATASASCRLNPNPMAHPLFFTAALCRKWSDDIHRGSRSRLFQPQQ